jgi:hypothetical protein
MANRLEHPMKHKRQGAELRRWLNSQAWRRLPDFLDMPDFSIGGGLQKSDIHAPRMLSRGMGKGDMVPAWCLAGIVRLFANGVIGRAETEPGSPYYMTAYSHEVLRHNASFRQRVRPVE